ncbi:22107_t:CDS:2, partial [Racocetra persica]
MKQIDDLGFNNSHSINTQMNINDKIIAFNGKIDNLMCALQSTIDYLFMVLLSETTTLLIMEDFKKEILIDSENDGSDDTDEEE